MSSSAILKTTTQALKTLLESGLKAEHGMDTVTVDLNAPRDTGTGEAVSLWLYRVGALVKGPPVPPDPRQARRGPGLALRLHYLVTALLGDPGAEHEVLGKVLQILHDHPLVRVVDSTSAPGTAFEVRVVLENLSLEDITRIWGALSNGPGYHLSMGYQVQVVQIDSAVEPDVAVNRP